MSFGVSAAAWAAVAAATVAVGTYAQYDAAKDAAKDQKRAQNQARADAAAAEVRRDQDFNRLNKKKPNVQGIMDANAASAGSSTMLTGPQGVDPNALLLGKQTLLGS